jgi:hypothetical protein
VFDDNLAFAKEAPGDGDAFVQQAAGVQSEIENQAFEIILAHTLNRFFDFA